MPEDTEVHEETDTTPSAEVQVDNGPDIGLFPIDGIATEAPTPVSTECDTEAKQGGIHSEEEEEANEVVMQMFQDDYTGSKLPDNHRQSRPPHPSKSKVPERGSELKEQEITNVDRGEAGQPVALRDVGRGWMTSKSSNYCSSTQRESYGPDVAFIYQGAPLGTDSVGESVPIHQGKNSRGLDSEKTNRASLLKLSVWGNSNRKNLSAAVETPEKTEEGMDMPNEDRHRINDQGQHKLAIRRVFRDQSSFSKTIHILGTGTISSFIAHSLADSASPPPVTLLLHSHLSMQQWHDEGGVIRVVKNNVIDSKSGLNVESSARFLGNSQAQRVPEPDQSSQPWARPLPDIIENLIVTTEGFATISALSAIKHRLRSYSTVCFIQDGLGIVDHVDSSVFPRPTSRPSYVLGNISHDLQSMGSSFTVRERRPGTLSLAIIPPRQDTGQVRRMDYGWTLRSRYLLRTLCQASGLNARGFLPQEFYKMQLERLAINAILGPLSVVYYCTNDQLLHNYQISRTMKLLIKEISMILQQLPEVSHISDISQHFSPERLEMLVLSVIGKTGRNRTTMLQAVIDGRKTNIDFYNGYLIDRAASLGFDCPNLEMIVAMVKGKQAMKNRERNSYIPFTDE